MIEGIALVRHPRAKRMRLSIDPASGCVRLTIPQRASSRAALRWAEGKRDWIAARRAELPRPRPFSDGAVIPVHGVAYRLRWDAGWSRRVALVGDELRCGGPREGFGGRIERWLRARALEILDAATREIAAREGISVARVSVGDPKSRWGSCSASGAIRYSWRLVLAPPDILRATVAHEVAHRLHMNHGADFHRCERALLGADPKPARAWLREHGASLHWFGVCAAEGEDDRCEPEPRRG